MVLNEETMVSGGREMISPNGSTIPEAAESGFPVGRSDRRERSGIVCCKMLPIPYSVFAILVIIKSLLLILI